MFGPTIVAGFQKEKQGVFFFFSFVKMLAYIMNTPTVYPPIYIQQKSIPAPLKEETHKNLLEKVALLAQTSIKESFLYTKALGKGAYLTLSYSLKAFDKIVFSEVKNPFTGKMQRRIPINLCIATTRILLWIGSLPVMFVIFTFLKKQNYRESETASLSSPDIPYLSSRFDASHFQLSEEARSFGEIPESIQLQDMLDLFDRINTQDIRNPHYYNMGQNNKEVLRSSLKAMILRIKNRTPYIGSPQATDIQGLEEFYGNIELRLRFSLHQANQKLAHFQKENGGDEALYNTAQKNIYRNCLEDLYQIAFDCAVAGLACAARYNGEAVRLSLYFRGENPAEKESLKSSIHTLLRSARLKIIEKVILVLHKGDTHAYSEYMMKLGPLLGIPGAEGSSEYLSNYFSVNDEFKRFSELYTTEEVSKIVQEKVKKKGKFQQLVYDWLLEQSAFLKLDTAEKEAALRDLIKTALSFNLESFQEHLPRESSWADLEIQLNDLTGEENLDLWIECIAPMLGNPEKEDEMFSKEVLRSKIQDLLQNQGITDLKKWVQKHRKIYLQAIWLQRKFQGEECGLFTVAEYRRLVFQETDRETFVAKEIAIFKKGELAAHLKLDSRLHDLEKPPLETEGLPPAFLSLLLTECGVLKPKVFRALEEDPSEATLSHLRWIKEFVEPLSWESSPLINNREARLVLRRKLDQLNQAIEQSDTNFDLTTWAREIQELFSDPIYSSNPEEARVVLFETIWSKLSENEKIERIAWFYELFPEKQSFQARYLKTKAELLSQIELLANDKFFRGFVLLSLMIATFFSLNKAISISLHLAENTLKPRGKEIFGHIFSHLPTPLQKTSLFVHQHPIVTWLMLALAPGPQRPYAQIWLLDFIDLSEPWRSLCLDVFTYTAGLFWIISTEIGNIAHKKAYEAREAYLNLSTPSAQNAWMAMNQRENEEGVLPEDVLVFSIPLRV